MVSDEHSFEDSKLYVGDVRTEDTKYLSTTGAECGSRHYFSSTRLGKTRHQFAFTLAEVLITLSIIGVVAALTIPSLIVNNQEKETVVQLKKIYNVLSNALALAEVEYGSYDQWGIGESENGQLKAANKVLDHFSPHLNIMQRCNGGEGSCFTKTYKKLNGQGSALSTARERANAVLADGTIISIWGGSNNSSIAVDLNGSRAPNTFGKDTFMFHLSDDKITPGGNPEDTYYSLKSQCLGGEGWGCTAWVLLKENMDYPSAGTGWE